MSELDNNLFENNDKKEEKPKPDEFLKLHLLVRSIFLVSNFEDIQISAGTKELVTNSKIPMFLMALVGGMISGIQISTTKGLMICLGLDSPLSHFQTYIFGIFCGFVVFY